MFRQSDIMTAKRGVIVFLVLVILIFSSVSFVSAQEPGAGFTLLKFLEVSIVAKGSKEILNDMQGRCSDSCAKYDPPSDKWSECLNICSDRSGTSEIIPSLALCEYILGKAEKGEFNSSITTESKTPEEIYDEMESRGDYSLIPFDEFGKYQTQFPYGLSYDERKIIRDKKIECLSKLSSLSEEEDLCPQCEKIESREAKEECYYECQKEDIPQDYALEDDDGADSAPSSAENELTDNDKTDTTTYVPKGSDSVYIKGYKGEVLIKDLNGNVKALTGKIALVGDGITLRSEEHT